MGLPGTSQNFLQDPKSINLWFTLHIQADPQTSSLVTHSIQAEFTTTRLQDSLIIRGILVSFLKWDLACNRSPLSNFCHSFPFPSPFLWATLCPDFYFKFLKSFFKQISFGPILEKAAPAYVKDPLTPGKESDLGLTQGRDLPTESSLTPPGFLWRSPTSTPT